MQVLLQHLLRLVLRLAFTPTVGGEMSILQQNTLEQIPTNITSALSRFNLHPSTTVYATCPSCSCLYKPVFKPGLSTAEYPSHCTNKPKPWLPICNQPLLQQSSTGHYSPVK